MNLIAALGQALDFIWKAAKAYSETPEGAKELSEVIVALEGADNTPVSTPVSETNVTGQRVRR